MNKSINWADILVLLILAVPVFLLIAPASFFDEGDSLCMSKLLFNIECYGCGLTRATQRLIHFQFQEAWEFNKLAFPVFPLLVWLYLSFLKETIKRSGYTLSKIKNTKLFALLNKMPTMRY